MPNSQIHILIFALCLATSLSFFTKIQEQACFEFQPHPGQSYNLEYYSNPATPSGDGIVTVYVSTVKDHKILVSGKGDSGSHTFTAEYPVDICFTSASNEAVHLNMDVYLDHHKQIKSIAQLRDFADLSETIRYTFQQLQEVARKEQFRADQQTEFAGIITKSENKVKFWWGARMLVLLLVVGVQFVVLRGLVSGQDKFQI